MGKIKKTTDDVTRHPHEILQQDPKKSSPKIITKNGKVKKKAPKQFTSYQCKVCDKKFTDKYNCTSHEKIHSTETFSCPICPYQGKTKKYLARHRKNVHGPATANHNCSVCGKKFQFRCNLLDHSMVHTGEKPHKCEVCGKSFRVTFSLNNHMLIHTNEKPYKCSFCEYACRDNSTLRKHENRHMGIVMNYTCKICPKKFPEKAKLKNHISEIHLDYLDIDARKQTCDKCGKAFKCKYDLNKHVQVVHERMFSCACPMCGRRLSSKANLPAHLRTHFNQRPYACVSAGCQKRFKDKSALKKHSIIHSPELQHPCTVCGALFTRVHRRDKHMAVHRPREKWAQCDYCGVAFYSKNYLIKHITRKHVANKEKFVCDKCGLVTYNKPSIVMHLKYGHSNEKDVKCKICKIKCKKFSYLKAHYLKTHNIRYKYIKKRKKKEEKPEVEVKVEKLDEPSTEIRLQLLDVYKEEIIDEEPDPDEDYLAYSKHVLSEDLSEYILNQREKPENQFEEFLFDHVFHRRVKDEEPAQAKCLINEDQRALVTQKIKEIMKKAEETEAAELLRRRRKKEARLLEKKLRREAKVMRKKRRQEIYELERVRQMYNERMRAAVEEENKREPAKTIKFFKQTTTDKINNEQTEKINNNGKQTSSYDISLIGDKDASSDGENTEFPHNNNRNHTNDSTNDENKHNKENYTEVADSNNRNHENDSTNDENNHNKENDTEVADNNNGSDSINNDDNDANHEKSDDGNSYGSKSPEDEPMGNKKLKFKTQQCYICFKLYSTKEDLISHCQSHFEICNATTLVKCPVCAYVASANISKHMFKKHGVQVKIPFNKITDRKDNAEGSRYCYKIGDGGTIMEIIPSVKILNHRASVAIDKRNRERREKTIEKTRLVKKGREWVVENVAVRISYNELPEFTEQELSKLAVSNSDSDRLGQLSRLAKKRGVKMVFPCNACDKICQNFSGLKLHGRRHDPNKKPFAPRKYKRDAKSSPAKKPEVNLENRLAKPRPIVHKHKCDEKLKKFYETHIRGADIEFWQFLKIFNKMDRENIRDFKDFEGTTEFGIHTNEDRSFNDTKTENSTEKSLRSAPKSTPRHNSSTETPASLLPASKLSAKRSYTVKISPMNSKFIQSRIKKPYRRVIMIPRRQHLEREKAKMKLRASLHERNI